jgi:hypothetical protein
MGQSGIVWVLMVVTLARCAGGGSESPVPPLTLLPPPTVTFAGSCSENSDLANWLEYSTFYVGEFVKRAVDGFQAVINQDADNLGSTVAEVLGQLDRVIAMQNELMARLEIQLQSP